MQAVYNLEIGEGYLPEFYANGVLVHNSVSRIPLVKLLGIQPSGLNASSEGEIRAFYDSIAAYQEAKFRIPITTVLNFVQLSLFGEVDPEITFEFKPLWQLDEVAKAGVQQVRAATRETDYAAGFISAEEGREAIAGDPESQYAGIDLSAALAPGEVEEEEGEFDPAVDPAEVETEKLENHPKPKTAGRLPQSLTTKAATFGSPATGGFPDR